ncbi:hypothetical protein [Serratia liquefaciens]|uniref:Uncharacterized protein n=1 Tax=Serratia liquefaciens TaxID=614 RepID=A0A515CTG0_SERLI|nr:hypothetical protein [Serratia liquefaciens]QDL31459.1 hypothetical protein EGO53_06545 [Serratia liquefaciens]
MSEVLTYEALKAERDALLMENVRLKDAITTHSQSTHFCELCGRDDPCNTDDVCYALNETPATSAALAAIEARGVEKFAAWASEQESMASDSSDKKEARIYCQVEARAKHFSKQLREGK